MLVAKVSWWVRGRGGIGMGFTIPFSLRCCDSLTVVFPKDEHYNLYPKSSRE